MPGATCGVRNAVGKGAGFRCIRRRGVPENHARWIRREVNKCPHGQGAEVETEHEFTLELDGISDLTREVVERPLRSRLRRRYDRDAAGRVSIGFTRSAPALSEAIVSAIADVRKAGIGARVVRVNELNPAPGSTEDAQQVVGAINGVLQASFAIELDPTLCPLVFRVLEYVG